LASGHGGKLVAITLTRATITLATTITITVTPPLMNFGDHISDICMYASKLLIPVYIIAIVKVDPRCANRIA
jgi:hypothetical protein